MFMIEKKIKEALKEIFNKNKIPKKIDKLKFGSFNNWDSLTHLNLLLLLEKKFKIKFSMEEMTSLKSINQIIRSIKKK